MLNKLSVKTMQYVVDDLLLQTKPFFITMKNGKPIDIVVGSPAMAVNPNKALSLIKEIAPEFLITRIRVASGDYCSVEIAIPSIEGEVRKGDILYGGAMINFSPIGSIAPAVQSYTVRLACTNGMTSQQFYGKWSKAGGNGDFDDWLRSSINESKIQFNVILDGYKKLVGEVIEPDDVEAVFAQMAKFVGFTKQDLVQVKMLLLKDPPKNMWEMTNLFSYATTHLLTDPSAIGDIMWNTSRITTPEYHAKVCPQCHRVIEMT